MSKPSAILLLGPLKHPDSPTGGAVVSFGHLVHFLEQQQGVSLKIINTNLRGIHPLLRVVKILVACIKQLTGCSIIWLNVSRPGFVFLAPLIWLVAKFSGKIFVLRKFGGDAIDNYNKLPKWWKWLVRNTAFRANLFLIQTKRELAFFGPISKKTAWFPTTRPATAPQRKGPFKKRFAFISRVTKTKGLEEIISVQKSLPPDYTLDVFGSIVDEPYAQLPFYRGNLAPSEVAKKLSDYDVLLLPTYYPGEGYPGIIIEAFRAGLPVIASRWQAIPEIIIDQYNGLLIQPQSASALYSAITFFNQDNFSDFQQAALESFNDFSLDAVNIRILEQVKALLLR